MRVPGQVGKGAIVGANIAEERLAAFDVPHENFLGDESDERGGRRRKKEGEEEEGMGDLLGRGGDQRGRVRAPLDEANVPLAAVVERLRDLFRGVQVEDVEALLAEEGEEEG